MRLAIAVTAVLLCACAAGTYARPPLELSKLLGDKDASAIWVLIVAGSNTWMNYRHQADVCHAYQIFHTHGVPDDHIVVMMYDDIANNDQNPTPGTIINKKNGPNVYSGVPHDYAGDNVTPMNFLNILQGESAAMSGIGSGKVIASGPDDYVFVNFVDHGAVGLVAFPDGELTADQLNAAIANMHTQNQYKQMVVYIEACESGSMLEKLPTDIEVYATTASNARESSYACYFDSELGTYLGDCYSVNWMENVDSVGTATETLEQQYEEVKKKTTTSHVMQYGQLSIDSEGISTFMGDKNSKHPSPQSGPASASDAVPVDDVPIAILMHKIHDTTDYWQKRSFEHQLMEQLMLREKVRSTMEEIVHVAMDGRAGDKDAILTEKKIPTDFVCYRAALASFSNHCFKFGEVEYALRHVHVLANLCEDGVSAATIQEAVEKTC